MARRKLTLIFIGVFCLIMVVPFILGAGKAQSAPKLDLDTPEIAALDVKECIEPVEYMRSSHMTLLDQWRNDVVREGKTAYVSSTGQVYEMSLDDTCLSCHSNPDQFCESCHAYSNVDLYCWECHGLTDDGVVGEG
ncbi:sulfate reduction electron transfer complex DsrMKJOP subunit DsrJ [Adlercreutzia sp. ZJ473]|uniref:sulfate reduction electron transfer complex DsrMKJOP subunit DsrJ n=1 Tax=Adlercreutzia sp. ZJ473 TaxID=2722822 RepID=UPI001555D3EF|nr:sulfate reduction electron transfer complex DsrMKJOP subunit DsrJ [Adlercreutzia sp. ZJ473]